MTNRFADLWRSIMVFGASRLWGKAEELEEQFGELLSESFQFFCIFIEG